MTLLLINNTWISIILSCLLVFISAMGIWQTVRRHFQRKPDMALHTMVPLGMVALVLGTIGLIRHYTISLQAADAVGEMTKLKLAHAVVHGSLNGAPYLILGLFCLGLSYVFKYINPSA